MSRLFNPAAPIALVAALSLAALAQVDPAEVAETVAEAVTEAVEEAAEAVSESTEPAAPVEAPAAEAPPQVEPDAETPPAAAVPVDAPAEEEPAMVMETPEEGMIEESPATETAPSVDDVIASGSGTREMASPVMVEPMVVASPVVEAAPCCEPVCCPIEVVASRARRSAKLAYDCHGGPMETTVCVDNPADCDCQLYAVPLCVPCCCVDEPQVCSSAAGPLGRGHVTLKWDCGFTAKVTFLKHGGVKIVYAG